MTEIQRYLAEEVAEDLADGIIPRREAIRRLGLLGVTGAAAAGLLATFAAGSAAAAGSEPRPVSTARRGAAETSWAPVARESITFSGPSVPLMAAWAPAAKPRGGVLVIHENRGLTEHIRTVAGRLAASGYSALALDLLSEEGGTGAFPGEAEVAAALAQIPPARFVDDMKASVGELGVASAARSWPRSGSASAARWCGACSPPPNRDSPRPHPSMGRSWRAATSRLPRGGARGLRRTRRTGQRDHSRGQGGTRGGQAKYELLTFTEADHAFFNDTGARFNPHAATEAWRRTLNWFDAAER